MTNLGDLQVGVKLAIYNPAAEDDAMFGAGIAHLCEGVRECGSLSASAKNMGMAYSKAHRIMKDAEQALGVPLLIREGTKGSELTAEGNLLLDSYVKARSAAQRLAAETYANSVSQEQI